MRTGRTILAVAFALLVAAPPALGAPGKLLDKASDDGFPSVFVTGGQLQTRAIIIRVTATPNRDVEIRWDLSCSKGNKGKFAIGEFVMSGKGKRRLKLTYKRPAECLVDVLAAYEDNGEGKIKLELFGRGGAKESPTK